jgi:ABC-type nitrate/sulfonate/bicarbonate transport system substrate-binding protein
MSSWAYVYWPAGMEVIPVRRPDGPFSIVALVSAMLIATVACSGAASPNQAPAKPAAAVVSPAPAAAPIAQAEAPRAMKTVRLGYIGGISDAAFYIAIDRGYFARQGIDLELTRFNSATDMVAPLSAGQLDVGSNR